MSRVKPGRRGGRAAGGCLHHPHMLKMSLSTPYLVLQQPVKLAFSKAQCSYLGTLWDEGRRNDEGRKERDYKDGGVCSGFPHIKGVQDSCTVICGQLLSVEQSQDAPSTHHISEFTA